MCRKLFGKCQALISGREAWDGRTLLIALLVIGLGLTVSPFALGQSGSNPAPPQSSALAREYLPTLRQKALLEAEREFVTTLDQLLKLFETLLEGGLVNGPHIWPVKRSLLQGQAKVLQRERNFDDSLDRFQSRFEVNPERLRELEAAMVLPVTRQFRQLKQVFQDLESVGNDVMDLDTPETAPRLRARLHPLIASAALVKGTGYREQLARRWASWEKLSGKELTQRLEHHATERKKLLDTLVERAKTGQALDAADQRRLSELDSEILLGRFEEDLRRYEGLLWKEARDPEHQRADQFHLLATSFISLLDPAFAERLKQVRDSWPTLPPVLVEKTDLLAGDWKQAEKVVASALKKPESAVAARAALRAVRGLAETYRLQQRLIELSFLQRGNLMGSWDLRGPRSAEGVKEIDVAAQTQARLQAERSVLEAKEQLIRTWIDYQVARLNLYRDLMITPP